MEGFSGSFTFTNKENTAVPQKPTTAPNSGDGSLQKTPQSRKPIIFKSKNNHNNNENTREGKKLNILHDGFKTPSHSKNHNHNHQGKAPGVIKRVPLGGKDKNTIFHNNRPAQNNDRQLSSSFTSLGPSENKRSWRLRTPKKKLGVLRDDTDANDVMNDKVNIFKDDDNGLASGFDDEIEYVPEREPEMADAPLNYEPFTDEELSHIAKISTSVRLEDLTDLTDRDEYEFDVNEEFPINFDEDEDDVKLHGAAGKENQFHFMNPTFVSKAKKISKAESFTEGLSSAELYQLIEEQ